MRAMCGAYFFVEGGSLDERGALTAPHARCALPLHPQADEHVGPNGEKPVYPLITDSGLWELRSKQLYRNTASAVLPTERAGE